MAVCALNFKMFYSLCLFLSYLFIFADSVPFQQKQGLFARLVEPPPRSVSGNYQHHPSINPQLESKCSTQHWHKHPKICSACGNVPNSILQNEANDVTIHRKYLPGDKIQVILSLSESRDGYMEFKLCNNGYGSTFASECFENNFLIIDESHSSRIYVPALVGNISIHLRIPPEVPCDRYVLQWKYVIGDDHDTDCKYCETYVNCANIAILDPSLPAESLKPTRRYKRQATDVESHRINRQNPRSRFSNNPQQSNTYDISGLADALSTSLGRNIFGTKENHILYENYQPKSIADQPQENAIFKNNAVNFGQFRKQPSQSIDEFGTIKQSRPIDPKDLSIFINNEAQDKSGISTAGTNKQKSMDPFINTDNSNNSKHPTQMFTFPQTDTKDFGEHIVVLPPLGESSTQTLHPLLKTSSADKSSILPIGFQSTNKDTSERRMNFKQPSITVPIEVLNRLNPTPVDVVDDPSGNSNILKTKSKYNLDGIADALSTSLGRLVFGDSKSETRLNKAKKQTAVTGLSDRRINGIPKTQSNKNLGPRKLHQFFDIPAADTKDVSGPTISFLGQNGKDREQKPYVINGRSNNLAEFNLNERVLDDFWQRRTRNNLNQNMLSRHPIGFQVANTQTAERPFEAGTPSLTVPPEIIAATDNTATTGTDAAGLVAAMAVSDGGVVDGVGDIASGVQDTMSNAVDTVQDIASSAGDSGLVGSVGDGFSDVAANMADVVSDTASTAGEVVSGLNDALPEIAPDGVSDIGSSVVDTASDFVDTVKDGMKDALPDISVPDVVGNVAEATAETISGIQDALPDGINDVASNVNDALPDISVPDGIGSVGEAAGEVISGIQDALPDGVGDVSALPDISVPDGVSNVAEAAGEAISGLQDALPDGGTDMVSDALPDISLGDGVTDVVSDIKDGISDIVDDTSLTDTLPDVVPDASISDIVTGDIADGVVSDTVSGIGDSISDIVDDTSLTDALPDVIPDASISDIVTGDVADGVGSVADVFSDTISDTGDVLSDVVDGAGGGFADLASDAVSTSTDSISDIVDGGIKDKVSDVTDTLADIFTGGGDNTFASNLQEGVSDVADTIGDVISDPKDSLASIIGDTSVNAIEKVGDAASNFVDNAKDGISDVKDSFGDVLDSSAARIALLGGFKPTIGGKLQNPNGGLLSRNIGGSSGINSGRDALMNFNNGRDAAFNTGRNMNARLNLFEVPPSPFKPVRTSMRRNIPGIVNVPPPPPPPSITLTDASSFPESFEKNKVNVAVIPLDDPKISSPNSINNFDDGSITLKVKAKPTGDPNMVSLTDSMLYVLGGDYANHQLGLDSIVNSDPNDLAKKMFKRIEERKLQLPATKSLGGLDGASIVAVRETTAEGNSLAEVLAKVGLRDKTDKVLELAKKSNEFTTGGISFNSDLEAKRTDTILDNSLMGKVDDTDIGLKDLLSDESNNAGDFVSKTSDTISNIVDNAKDAASNIQDSAGSMSTGDVKDVMVDVVDNAFDRISDLTGSPRDAVSDFVDNTKDMVSNVNDGLSDVIGTGRDTLSDVVDKAADVPSIGDIASNVRDGISNVIDARADVASNIIDSAADATSNLRDTISDTRDNVRDMGSNVMDAVSDNGWNKVISNVGEGISNIGEKVGDVISNVGEGISNVRENAGDALSNVVDAQAEAISNVKDAVSNVADTGNEIVSGISDRVSDLGGGIDSDKLRTLALANAMHKSSRTITPAASDSVIQNVIGSDASPTLTPGVDLVTFFKTGPLSVNQRDMSNALGVRKERQFSSGLGFDFQQNPTVIDRMAASENSPDSVNLWSWSQKNPLISANTQREAAARNRLAFRRQSNTIDAPTRNKPSLQKFLLNGITSTSGRVRPPSVSVNLDKSLGIGPADAGSRVGIGVNSGQSVQSFQPGIPYDSIQFQNANQGFNSISSRTNSLPLFLSRGKAAEFSNQRKSVNEFPSIGVKSKVMGQPLDIQRPGLAETKDIPPKQTRLRTLDQQKNVLNNFGSNIAGRTDNIDFVSMSRINGNELNTPPTTFDSTIYTKHHPVDIPGVCKSNEEFDCTASGPASKVPGIDWWCVTNCREGNCQQDQCTCHCISKTTQTKRRLSADEVNRIIALQRETEVRLRDARFSHRQYKLAANMNCKPTQAYAAVDKISQWCNVICAMGKCPAHVCNCP